MGPQRTFAPVKPIKTERTHEENQERAYIAASRRSDRSLEARVESARRASEIHKRRTGRSLRVTEQDVINEEMYEEEDDDLPSQYRRLTAHLQTGSVEFNRRLANYLTNHVAMRTALNDAINGNFVKHYPNAPHFAHNQTGMQPSPIVTQGFAQHPGQQQSMYSPSSASPRSLHPYRNAPYSIPNQSYRPQAQQRPVSMVMPGAQTPPVLSPTPMTPAGPDMAGNLSRRMSMPATVANAPEMQTQDQFPSPKSDILPKREQSAEAIASASKPSSAPASVANAPESSANSSDLMDSSQRQPRPTNIPNFPRNNLAPFSMALPLDSQQIVNQAALPQNDFGAALMGGYENWSPHALGASDPGQMIKSGSNFYPSSVGMNATLAPEEMFKNPQQHLMHQAADLTPDGFHFDATGSVPGYDFNRFIDFNAAVGGSNQASATATPGLDSSAWDDYLDSSWAENANQT